MSHITAAEAFNKLCHLPKGGFIDLGDGRELGIRDWEPSGTLDTTLKHLKVTIVGFIRMKKEDDTCTS